MEATPFAAQLYIRTTWPYLGAAVTSLSGAEGIGQQHPDAFDVGVAGTHGRTNSVHMSRDDSSATQSDHQPASGHN